jgi:hypothetical protein
MGASNNCIHKTGDKVYPKNVTDITKIDIANIGADGDINIADIAKSELISWFRYNLNYNGYNKVAEPKVLIPKSTLNGKNHSTIAVARSSFSCRRLQN